MATEAKGSYEHLMSIPGVVGVMLINHDGLAIRSTLSHEETLKYAGQIAPLVEKSRKIMRTVAMEEEDQSDVGGSTPGGSRRGGGGRHNKYKDNLVFIRIRTLKHEILVSPCEENDEYILIALQEPFIGDTEEEDVDGVAPFPLTEQQ